VLSTKTLINTTPIILIFLLLLSWSTDIIFIDVLGMLFAAN